FTANSATSDFAAEDITVSGGTISNFASTSDTVYTATFTPSADGPTTVDVAAGGFTDSGGNSNAAATQFTWTYDGTGPTVAITTSESDPATGSTFDVTITFGEATTTFASGDITVGGGSVSAFSATSSTVYVATITPSADGTVTVDVAAGIATDTYGNDNSAATQFSIESDQADAPSITSTAVTAGTEDSVYSYSVVASDADDGAPNSNTMTLDCTTCPSWLSLTDNGDGTGTLSGTPGDDDLGANSVVLTVEDGDSLSSTQSFTVTVANVNDVGTISLSGTPTEAQDLTATVGDDDGLSGVTVTYEWQRSSDASTWTTISGATSSTYTLTQDDVDNYMRVIAVWTDAQGGSESHSAMISTTVANANDANTGTPTISGTTTEDEELTVDATPLDGNDEDGMTGSSYSYQWQRCTSTATSTCSDISSATSTTYTLGNDDAEQYLRVGVSYDDDYGTTETVYSDVTAQITNVNDAPSAGADQAGAVTEDDATTTATGTVDSSDADPSDVLSYTVSTSTAVYGSASVSSSGVWTYTLDNADADTTALDAGDTVTDSFTILVTDSAGSTDTMGVMVTITGADDAVSAGADQTGAVTEDAATTTATGTMDASDADADSSLSYTGSGTGTYGSISIDSATGAWTYTLDNTDADTTALDADDSVTDTFTMTVTDSASGETDTMDVIITVTGADDAVSAGTDQSGAVTEDAATDTATGTMDASDADADSSLSYSGDATGTYGSIAVDSAGAWTYTLDNTDADTTALDAGDSVTDTFTLTVTDSDSSATDTMTVTITITGADDAVSAGADQTGAVTEDAATDTATGTVDASDADADSSLSYSGDAT
ncbi:MAG: VCBS domain-containing protein, partial [Euryarchaeota archaeon]